MFWKSWDNIGCFGMFWYNLGHCVMFWDVFGVFWGVFLDVLGCFFFNVVMGQFEAFWDLLRHGWTYCYVFRHEANIC